jgi:hypothetical protein
MLYLDYILYIIIIVLLCILVNKLYNKKEGFSHKGKSNIASTKKIQSIIKSAEYGDFGEWSDVSGFNKRGTTVDVKAVLDRIINKGTKEIVVSPGTFDITDPSQDKQKYLLIKFTKPNVIISDSIYQFPNWDNEGGHLKAFSGAYIWAEGDSVSLKFANYEANPFWLTSLSAIYKIAELLAIIIIKMPYKFLNQMVNLGITFIENFRDIFKPIFEFIDQMKAIAKSIFKQLYRWFKWGFDQWLAMIKDLPKFLRSQLKNFTNFLQALVTNIFSMFQMFFDLFMKVFNTLIQLPMQLFSMIEQIGTMLSNLFTILINIPTAGLNMIIGFQNIAIDAMSKTPTIPFMNLFLQ